jgi:hypothetical protein
MSIRKYSESTLYLENFTPTHSMTVRLEASAFRRAEQKRLFDLACIDVTVMDDGDTPLARGWCVLNLTQPAQTGFEGGSGI